MPQTERAVPLAVQAEQVPMIGGAADPESAARHFEGLLAYETDCWDVSEATRRKIPGFVVLDVRSPALYAAGHVPGAVNLPHGRIVARNLEAYPGDTLFVVYCSGPQCNGADRAALAMARLGRPVKKMIGGIEGWKDEGLGLEARWSGARTRLPTRWFRRGRLLCALSRPPPSSNGAFRLSETAGEISDPGSIAFLRSEGFEGFRTISQLNADRCEEIPNIRGIYAIVRESLAPPQFMLKSAAARFRDTDPTIPIDELDKLWVPGAQILYFGRARGPGVRSLLKQRVKRYLRFGHGRHVAHWGGRAIWQLSDRSSLRVAWKPTPKDDPARAEGEYQDRFERHHGALPFANLKQESDE